MTRISVIALPLLATGLVAVASACTTTTTTTSSAPASDGGAAPAPAPKPEELEDPEPAPPATGSKAPSDGKCHPTSSEGRSKAPYSPPKGENLGLCSDAMITSYQDCRAGVASACTVVTQSGQACKACIESQESDPTWGPLVFGGASPMTINEAGCGALVNKDTGTNGCGQGLAEYTDCLRYTCEEQCSGSDYVECAVEARATECKSIVDGLKISCPEPLGECFAQPGETVKTFSRRMIQRFCGAAER